MSIQTIFCSIKQPPIILFSLLSSVWQSETHLQTNINEKVFNEIKIIFSAVSQPTKINFQNKSKKGYFSYLNFIQLLIAWIKQRNYSLYLQIFNSIIFTWIYTVGSFCWGCCYKIGEKSYQYRIAKIAVSTEQIQSTLKHNMQYLPISRILLISQDFWL